MMSGLKPNIYKVKCTFQAPTTLGDLILNIIASKEISLQLQTRVPLISRKFIRKDCLPLGKKIFSRIVLSRVSETLSFWQIATKLISSFTIQVCDCALHSSQKLTQLTERKLNVTTSAR